MISPTQLLIKTLNIAPEGSETAAESGCCVMCAGHYGPGDVIEPFTPGDSFTDYADLQYPAGTHICGACKATWRKEFMQNYTKSVVGDGALFPFFSNDAVAYWLLNPPPPPYLMFISTQQLGHIVWKVPVNLSRDVMLVRYNDKVLKIRRGHLLEGIEAARLLSDRLIAAQAANTKGKPKSGAARKFINPLSVDRSLERAGHGAIRSDVRALAEQDSEAAQAIRILETATIGETWALAHILYSENPAKPEAKLLPNQL